MFICFLLLSSSHFLRRKGEIYFLWVSMFIFLFLECCVSSKCYILLFLLFSFLIFYVHFLFSLWFLLFGVLTFRRGFISLFWVLMFISYVYSSFLLFGVFTSRRGFISLFSYSISYVHFFLFISYFLFFFTLSFKPPPFLFVFYAKTD